MKDEKYILDLIAAKAEESISLEFKAAGALADNRDAKKEIAKDVSSIANSAGGILIYGINEIDHIAHSISPIDGNVFTKEWLEQVIDSWVDRKIEGLIINPIRIGQNIAESVYVVTIPESLNAPHMTDGRFYRRYNFKATQMEEYEVRNLYSRITKAALTIQGVLFHPNGVNNSHFGGYALMRFRLVIEVKNIGRSIEKNYKLEVSIPTSILDSGEIFSKRISERREGVYSIYSIPNESPLFQGEINRVASIPMVLNHENFRELNDIPLRVVLYYSNNVETQEVKLKETLRHGGKLLSLDMFNPRG